jgi:hypothetical protein
VRTQIGADPGLIQTTLAENKIVDLMINSTNSHGDPPIFEWLLLTANIGGNSLPLLVLSDKGLFALNPILPYLSEFTYSFDRKGVTYIGTMSMADLGLQAGDTLAYGYAYMNPSDIYIVDNIVMITVN